MHADSYFFITFILVHSKQQPSNRPRSVFLFFINASVPSIIGEVVAYVGNVTTPLAMMIIGSTLAKMNPKEVFADLFNISLVSLETVF